MVVMYHIFIEIYPASPSSSAILPHIFLFDGALAVSTFFVVSGYSLSIGYCCSGQRSTLLKILAGRYFRLTVPIAFGCMIAFVFAKAGLTLDAAHRETSTSFAKIVKFAL